MTQLGTHYEITTQGDQVTHTIHPRRTAYTDESGHLQRIVSDWEDSGIPSRPHIVTRAPFLLSVADDGARRFHPTRELDRYFEIGAPLVKVGGSWQQVSLGSPERSGNLLAWTTANANLYLRMAGHFAKLGILLKGGWVPEDGQFAFPVGLTGLTRSGGTILADGQPVMSVRKPHVEDYDNPDDVRDIAHEFTQVAGQWYVVFTLPDLSGMSRPLVDPTLELQPDATNGLDNTITQRTATTNLGNTAQLMVGEANNADAEPDRVLIKFDLSSLPALANISSTTLRLWLHQDGSYRADNSMQFDVYRVRRAWVETQSTWNIWSTGNNWTTAGCGDTTDDREASSIGTSPAWLTTDSAGDSRDTSLTPTTKAALDLGNGWLLQAQGESDDMFQVKGSDHTTAAERPTLIIVYTLPASSPMIWAGWAWTPPPN